MKALKGFAALLSYPSAELQHAVDEIDAVLASEPRIPARERAALRSLQHELRDADLLDLQQRYVALFDCGRATSLNLYEHVHGDSRDRGQAMVDLVDIYRRGGMQLATTELPDHLPVLLEYLSTRPTDEVREMLADCAHLLRAIGEALAKRESRYAAVLSALLVLAGERGIDTRHAHTEVRDDRALDDEWVEPPVLFGLGCGDARSPASVQPVQFVRRSA